MKTRNFLYHYLWSVLLLWSVQSQAAPITIPVELGGGSYGFAVYSQELPSQYPCISDRTFRRYCDHEVSCTSGSIDPEKVMLGDTIFVADWYMTWFYEVVHPYIHNQYILVSGDTDVVHPSGREERILYDRKIGAWVCRELLLSNHPKLIHRPVGPTALNWGFPKDVFLDLAEKSSFENKLEFPLLYFSVTQNNVNRKYVHQFFADKTFCFSPPNRVCLEDFWASLSQLKFCLTPPGTVIDTPRFWECLTLHSIPICMHSTIDELYEGTPSLLVNSWEDVTEEFLKTKHLEIQEKWRTGEVSNEKASFDYWAKKIEQIQEKVRNGSWNGHLLEAAQFDDESLKTIKEILYTARSETNDLPENCLFIIYGKATGIRPFQLCHAMNGFKKVIVGDPYILHSSVHQSSLAAVAQKQSQNLFENKSIEFMNSEIWFQTYITVNNRPVKMFLDLTHHRHKIADILWWFCQLLPFASVICGNMAEDPYVKEQLHEFSARHCLPIETKSDFWYFTEVGNLKHSF